MNPSFPSWQHGSTTWSMVLGESKGGWFLVGPSSPETGRNDSNPWVESGKKYEPAWEKIQHMVTKD